MLAILSIEMNWRKENRTPNAAIQRKEYYKPIKIEDGITLDGEGIFLKKCNYFQQGDSVRAGSEISAELDKKLYEEGRGKAFTGKQEQEQKLARIRNQTVQKEKGFFYSIEAIDIPCVTIEEADNCYRVKWFDYGSGMPRRKGRNEDFNKKGSKLAGQPNVLNETAFVLEEGKAGLLKYNYRYTSYHGQWYKCYYVYIVNEKELTQDIFMRSYDYEYNQLADLF